MQYRLRIIGGDLRGRKIDVKLDPKLRPMSDRARGAFFNILMHEIPERPFFDIFAGSGAVGLEALSRGARQSTFIEKDGAAVQAILKHAKIFGVSDQVRVLQVDAYRWIEKGAIPKEPANYFLGPPYTDISEQASAIRNSVEVLQSKIAPGSVLVLQTDDDYDPEQLPDASQWDVRRYGRNQLAIWHQPDASRTRTEDADVRTVGTDTSA
ncbi:MAG: RsmD family RNA methyltransferase [Planctomycetia bacterium]|nr:RsmD family RNA methyltransferase [Planctomycetia bacterium]